MTEQEIVAHIEALKPNDQHVTDFRNRDTVYADKTRFPDQQQVVVTRATEWVVVSDWAPLAGKPGTGGLSYEDFTDRRRAEEAYWDYERGEYPRARAVCIFASRNGVPIGRIA
jgi:hypothetical protein